MKKKFMALFALLFVPCILSMAQIGRHEMPIDTISIGGPEQDRMMTHLEGYEQLLADLKTLRDSVETITELPHADNNQSSEASAKSIENKKRLNALIGEMEKKDADKSLMKEGYQLLDDVRRDMKEHRSGE